MKDGKRIVAKDCLKSVVDCDDFSYALKLEGYANRDSTVFMKGLEMEDCPTFMRGTLRFKGFCTTIQAFHETGMTSDEPVPSYVKTLNELAKSVVRGPKTVLSPLVEGLIKSELVGATDDDL